MFVCYFLTTIEFVQRAKDNGNAGQSEASLKQEPVSIENNWYGEFHSNYMQADSLNNVSPIRYASDCIATITWELQLFFQFHKN